MGINNLNLNVDVSNLIVTNGNGTDRAKQVSSGSIAHIDVSLSTADQLDTVNSGHGAVSNANMLGAKTISGDISSQQGAASVPEKYLGLINSASQAIAKNDTSKACEHFSSAITNMLQDGMPVDVNALVQQVLRESYMDTTADLQFYADKVKYFNEAKKMTREYVQDLRDFKTAFSKAAQSHTPSFCISDPPSSNDPNFLEWVNFQREYISEHRADASFGGAAAGMNSVVASYKAAVAQAETAACSGPGVKSCTKSGDWVEIIDNDGYKIRTNVPVGDVVQISNPDGTPLVEIWGDPHVCEGKFETGNDWHFGDDSTFILPNGTKVCLNTEEQDKGSGIFYTKGVDVLSGSGHAQLGLDPVTGTTRTPEMKGDRAEWDMNHADTKGTSGGVFAVAEGSKAWAKLGDDGKFYDITNVSFDSYKAAKSVQTNSTVVAMPDSVMTATKSTSALKNIAENAQFANVYPDTQSGQIASDLGLPTMIPPAGCTTAEELDNIIQKYEEKLSSIGDDAQLANTDLQNILQKQQQTLQMMSNISKTLNDTAMAVIRKIG